MVDLKLREEKRLNNRRKYPRFETQLKAKFVSAESQRGGEDCTIIDFSRKGMRAEIYTNEEINVKPNEKPLSILLGGGCDINSQMIT